MQFIINIFFTADGVPTCIEFVQCDSNHAVVSHHNGKIVLYDLETGKTPVMLADDDGGDT